ncbi:MAG: N-acetylglucosamine-6-phosphate deacetylase [Pseudomonadota bacterium]|nr:N-acetylglucosamine-6-phosphate deacetylase [Gammaproteobacteria bacterium]MBU1558591.1 N-acetylglucosamine-6-phosphate deacetylase [Gammaproteobacteria bacterium]MBU1629071.1 N-acetylglucosamine-6-phosphate deacetylase [Gammaproteobacteria bacterium]MBU1926383.1 N-acetylglucosamine-6-phosphate deacetylase [Gammaproteobacteria bacterium]MBU2545777.1 N-acetylglucosamine-6-phosphate deacetylase [Gammaproteobacteria bacterium]
MQSSFALKGATIYTEQGPKTHTNLNFIGEVIESIDTDCSADEVLTLPSSWHVIPGMIDAHIHGAANADTMDATPKALQTISKALAKEGVTGFLPTTITANNKDIEKALMNVKEVMEKHLDTGAQILGVNLEGPFLSPEKAGAQDVTNLQLPQTDLLQRWQTLSGYAIKIVTVAPELPGAMSFIQYLRSQKIIPSLGHSNASYELTNEAIQAGITQATHLFNAMHRVHHREPGNVVALLLNHQVMCEVIADGIHLHPAILKLILTAKTTDRIILITDAIRAKQLPDGEYTLGTEKVIVKNESSRFVDGTLAGTVLRMDQAMRNMMKFTGSSLNDICKMASENPAKQLQIFDRKGSLSVGKDADIVVLDDQLKVQMTFVKGKMVYKS